MIVVVVGTDTDIGKTYVTAAIARILRERGVKVAVRKPVQSFREGATDTDADLLGNASGESANTVCPPHRWIPLAMAPPIAAEQLGIPPFTIADLVRELVAPVDALTLVESVGGVRSPVAADGDTVDLVAAIRAERVLLVADAGLGTINAVRLSLAALAPRRVFVFLNRFDPGDPVHVGNLEWLHTHDGIESLTRLDELATVLGEGRDRPR